MPLENLEEEGLAKNPKLELAQTKFLLSLPKHKNDAALKTKLMDVIKAESELHLFSHRDFIEGSINFANERIFEKLSSVLCCLRKSNFGKVCGFYTF